VTASAILDPIGSARFEQAMATALDGPRGLAAVTAGVEGRGLELAAAVAVYQTADTLKDEAVAGAEWGAGYVAGVTAPVWVPAAGLAFVGDGLLGGDPAGDLTTFMLDHPGLSEAVAGSSPGLISGLNADLSLVFGPAWPGFLSSSGYSPFPLSVNEAAGLTGSFYPDGSAVIEDRGIDDTEAMRKTPSGLSDLWDGLAYRNGVRPQPGDTTSTAGNIDVRKIVGPDGSVSFVVDIPGTQVWDMTPGATHRDLTDMSSNFNSMAGNPTGYEDAVAQALAMAGASSTDPVMLVGHSQGGIVAMDAAAHFVTSNRFNVTHVMTGGSPVGGLSVPSSVNVLSLENSNDMVPRLDGTLNPDLPNRTTVSFHNNTGTPGGNHDAGPQNYGGIAHQLDTSTDPAVVAYRNSLQGAFTYPTGPDGQGLAHVTTHQYEVTRAP
jgi:hypothetical protein